MKPMKNKFTLIVLLFILYGMTASAATTTVSLPTVTKSNGEVVSLPLTVTDFSNIGSFNFVINIDPVALNFIQVTDKVRGSITANVTSMYGSPALAISWISSGADPITIANGGAICNLEFKFKGTPSSLNSLTFNLPLCEVATLSLPLPGPIPVNYTNGLINPFAGNTATAKLNDGNPVYGATGAYVAVPLKFAGFLSNVGAVTQVIHYDASKLTFVNVTKAGVFTTANVNNPSPGVLEIAWSSLTGVNINYNWPSNGMNLNFIFEGSGTSNITFAAGCEVTTITPTNYLVSFTDGTVVQQAPTSFASLGANITGATYYNNYSFPVTLTNLPSNTGAFSLYYLYNRNQLEFINISDQKDAVNSNVIIDPLSSTATLKITWANGSPPPGFNINGIFMNLNFRFKGIQPATISYGPGCLFSDSPLANPINVGFTSVTISPATNYTRNAYIGCATPAVNGDFSVPITFDGLPANMGSATLYVTYDYSKLTYTGVTNNSFNATVQSNINTHIIAITWSDFTGKNINGTFLNLGFHYTSGDNAYINFIEGADGPELMDVGVNRILVNWNNGGANNLYKISGNLKYNSDPNPELPLIGYTITLKSNPGGVVIATSTTDANGYYSFWAGGNSSYSITIVPGPSAQYNSDIFDVLTMYDYVANGIPIPNQIPLRIKAGDVNENGDIDIFDVLLVYDRVANSVKAPEYTAPDFVFDTTNISVNCSNLPNVTILGLSSGNVLGTNPNP